MSERRIGHIEVSKPIFQPTPLPVGDRQGPPNRGITAIGAGESGRGGNGGASASEQPSPSQEGIGSTAAWIEASLGMIGATKAGMELYANSANLWEENVHWYGRLFTQAALDVGLPPNVTLGVLSAGFTAVLIDGIRRINQTR